MQDTSIAWADWTWNPIRGCSRISLGCMNCYAEAMAARFSNGGRCVNDAEGYHSVPSQPFHGFAEFRIIGGKREAHWTGRVELIEEKLLEPLSWRRKALKFAKEHGRKPRAFISMSDLFHENLPDEDIDRVFAVAALTPEINYMILTKRARRMAEYFSGELLSGRILCHSTAIMDERIDPLNRRSDDLQAVCQTWEEDEPLANVALGVSVESQKYADERIPHLLRTPAAMRFVSYEPALEAVNFERHLLLCRHWKVEDSLPGFPSCPKDPAKYWLKPQALRGMDQNIPDLIIVGGESGPGARPFDIEWARKTVKQCREAGVAPFFKQAGSNCHDTGIATQGAYFPRFKDRKGEDMSEWPNDLRVREWPEGWAG